MRGGKRRFRVAVFVFLLVMGAVGCSEDGDNRIVEVNFTDSGQSCVVCHTDQQILMELAVEKPAGHSDAGEG